MSLINDALKKAQKMRAQDLAAPVPSLPVDGSGPVAKRARPMPARWLAGIVAGAAVLVAGSVLATFLWLRNPGATPTPKPVAPPASVSESPPPPLPTAAAAPIVVVAPPAAVSATAPVAPKTEPHPAVAVPDAPAPPPESGPLPPTDMAGAPPGNEVHAPPVAHTEIRPATAPAPTARPDARAQAFVDALRVAGIRASGSDSKVLMNDRVFRLNDIVERTLGLRLTGVAADRLAFTDGNGVVYTRNF
jgi:hypothetical protein